jgi:hypothetical protein
MNEENIKKIEDIEDIKFKEKKDIDNIFKSINLIYKTNYLVSEEIQYYGFNDLHIKNVKIIDKKINPIISNTIDSLINYIIKFKINNFEEITDYQLHIINNFYITMSRNIFTQHTFNYIKYNIHHTHHII